MKLPEIMKAKTKPLATIPLSEVGGAGTPRIKVITHRAAARPSTRHHGQGRRRAVCRVAQAGARMTKVLIIAEHAGGKLNASTAKCVKAADHVGRQ